MGNELERKNKIQKATAIIELLLLLFIILGIPAYIYFYHHELIEDASNLKHIEAFLMKYKAESALIYVGSQVLQILISIIPGQMLQFAAGYLYGFWLGYILSVIGAFIGSLITYYLAKLIGKKAVHVLFGERKIKEVLDHMNSKRAVIIVFLIYLIPGLPKDLCNYAAGLSELKFKPFIIISLLGRTPGMMGSLLIGNQVVNGDYTSAIVIGVIAVVLFILGLIFRNRVLLIFNKFYDKFVDNEH